VTYLAFRPLVPSIPVKNLPALQKFIALQKGIHRWKNNIPLEISKYTR
jgi:hypothetical protein